MSEKSILQDINVYLKQYLTPQEVISLEAESYDLRWLKWQSASIQRIQELLAHIHGEAGILLTQRRIDQILEVARTVSANQFLVVDPHPKSIESIESKIQRPEVKGVSNIFDFMRCALIAQNKSQAIALTNAVRGVIHSTQSFLPLTEEERTLRSHVVPEENQIGDRRNKGTISDLSIFLDEHPEEFGVNMRCKTGLDLTDVPPFLRMEIRIITPELYGYMNNDTSPFSHSKYQKTRERNV